jgi:WD40 repeat protein
MESNADMHEYSEFRRLILAGSLYILKHELIHVLYKIYIRLIKMLFKYCVGPSRNESAISYFRKLASHKNDYLFSPRYIKEIHYIENLIDGHAEFDAIKEDKELMSIFSSEFRIVLSRYAYQMLLSVVEKNGFKFISSSVFSTNKQKILISDSLFTESYIGEGYISDQESIEEVEKINARNYVVGMLREQYNFLVKLEEVVQKKHLGAEKNVEAELELKYPIEKSSSTFMSNCPEYKNKYLVDFARDYINRHSISRESHPSVLMVNVSDPEDKISCTEFNRMFKVFVIGTYHGKIRCVFLTEDSVKDHKDEYKKENQRLYPGEGPEDLLRPSVTLNASAETVDIVDLIGHSGTIMSLSLNYDSSYLVSGSSDGAIRLWYCRSGTCLAIFRAHIKSVWSVKIAPRGFYFASGGADKLIYLWSTNSGQPLKKFIGHKEEVSLVDFTKNMIYIISASLDKSIRIWNTEDCSVIRIFFFENPLTS